MRLGPDLMHKVQSQSYRLAFRSWRWSQAIEGHLSCKQSSWLGDASHHDGNGRPAGYSP